MNLTTEIKLYAASAFTWILSYITTVDAISITMEIAAAACAVVTTILAFKKYLENRELHKEKMKSEQMEQDIKAQKYMYYLKKNNEPDEVG